MLLDAVSLQAQDDSLSALAQAGQGQLRCIGGQIQGRLVLDTEEKRERARKMGVKDPRKKYEMEDMVRGDCLFS